ELQTETDPRENTTSYTNDQWGNPASILGPEGSLTTFTHDSRGRRLSATDANGNTTGYTHNPLDYLEKIIHPEFHAYLLPVGSGREETFQYDEEGNLLQETDRLGLTLSYAYTSRNQVEKITRNVGGEKTFTYDENGNVLTESDWKGAKSEHAYDARNQRVSTKNRLGHTRYMTCDFSGNVVQTQDYEGRITTNSYDKLNRLTNTWQPALDGQDRGRLQYAYYNEADPETNLKSKIDQEGNPTTYQYNGRYLKTRRTNALGDERSWEYDAGANPIREIDEEGRVATREYDKQNRLIAENKYL
ncbi:MAG: RHS repeat protein, partial [bacterium]|nr:RHS repeat protein [bacterium]